MTVTVRLFARAKDLAGVDVLSLVLPDGARIADLRRGLAAAHPRLGPLLERSALAVNEEFADDSSPLSTETVVALLPPVSGG
jgi:molybdopterin converting factor subunit 1